MEYDAELRDAIWFEDARGGIFGGLIYGDKKGRFQDGEFVYTSTVQSIEKVDSHKIVHTRNSIYKVFERT